MKNIGESKHIKKNSLSLIHSQDIKFEMKWGEVRGVSQPLSEESDLMFSILQPLSSILQSYNQSFSMILEWLPISVETLC